MPTLTDLNSVNDVETRYSLLVRNHMYAGLRLFPPFESSSGPGQSGTFWKYSIRDFQKTGDVKRAEDGTAYEIRYKPTTATFTTSEKAKRIWVRDVNEMYADPAVRPSRTATLRVTNELLLGHEKEVAAMATDTAIMTQNVTLAGVTQLSDFTNSDPLDVFADARLAMKYVPYSGGIGKLIAVMAPEVLEILRQHPDLQARFANTDGLVSNSALAEVMGVSEIVVAEAWKDTADDAAASATEARVWGKHIVIAYVDATKAEETMSFAFTVFSRMPGTSGIVSDGGMGSGTPLRVRDYREEQKGGGGYWREADAAWDLKVVMPELAYLIKDAVA